ncbi:MAG: sugar phosphate isomerase/epimerase family protein [Nitrospinota bacterium]|nr:sugar phosphate isomerase/epimerase [Nitrospinota bacterium]
MNKENIHIRMSYKKIDELLPLAIQEGKGVEIFLSSYFLDRPPIDRLAPLREYIAGGQTLSLHAPFMDLSPGGFDEKVRTLTADRVIEAINVVADMNPKTVVIHPGYDRFRFDGRKDIWLKNSLETWNRVLAETPKEIKLAVENVFDATPEILIELIEALGTERAGHCFDTGHFNLFGKISLEKWIGMVKPYLIEMHLHDNSGGDDQHLSMGEGTFDFDRLAGQLADLSPILTLESHTKTDLEKSLKFMEAWNV